MGIVILYAVLLLEFFHWELSVITMLLAWLVDMALLPGYHAQHGVHDKLTKVLVL